jgi:hypothetical protein
MEIKRVKLAIFHVFIGKKFVLVRVVRGKKQKLISVFDG